MFGFDALICGASRGIGLAMTAQLCAGGQHRRVFALSRQAPSCDALKALAAQYSQLVCLNYDATNQASADALVQALTAQQANLNLVINTVGLLHSETIKPEKNLSQLNEAAFLESMLVNAYAPLRLAQAVKAFIPKATSSVFASLSARVGSISDNHLGGWYSYRASKAAQNMLLKNLSIEWERTLPQACVLVLHPGTTDTELSKPFSANTPPEKLFSADFAAQTLLGVIAAAAPTQTGSFIDYAGKPITW